MDSEKTKKRSRPENEELSEDKEVGSVSKRQKIGDKKNEDEAKEEAKREATPLIPTLIQIGSEEIDGMRSYLALHKTREDRERFFQWMNSLDEVYNYTVLVTMTGNEDTKLIVKEMEEALREAKRQDDNKIKKSLKDVQLFFQEEKKEDFLGVWIHQDQLSLGTCIPRSLQSNGLAIDMQEFKTLLAADFC